MTIIDGMNMIWNIRNAIVYAEGVKGHNIILSVDTIEAQYGLPESRRGAADDTHASTQPPPRGLGFLYRLVWSHHPPLDGPHRHLTIAITVPTDAVPVLLIDVLSTIWRPKQQKPWSNPEYVKDIDKGFLVFK
jgi:hypothetical protein